MFIYVAIFLFIILLYLLSLGKRVEEAVFLLLMSIFFIFFAGLRGDGVSRDYINYKETFSQIKSFSEYFDSVYLEPSYYFFPALLKALNIFSFPLIFTLFSFLGVSLKTTVIFRYSNFFMLSLLVYYSQYFILHEMTQIRIGVAAGFLLLSLEPLLQRRWILFFLCLLLAVSFHYSAILFVIVLFLNPNQLNKVAYLLLLACSIIMGVLHYDMLDILSELNLGIFSQKIDTYITAQREGIFGGDQTNIFNVMSLLNIALSLLFIIKWEIIAKNNKYGVVLIKLFVLSNVIFYFFNSFTILAWRLSELFAIGQIILLPCLVYIFNPRWLGIIAVILLSFLIFYLNVYYSELLNSYF